MTPGMQGPSCWHAASVWRCWSWMLELWAPLLAEPTFQQLRAAARDCITCLTLDTTWQDLSGDQHFHSLVSLVCTLHIVHTPASATALATLC